MNPSPPPSAGCLIQDGNVGNYLQQGKVSAAVPAEINPGPGQ